MIVDILKNALKSAEAEKDRAVATAKEKATREKVIPFNAEVDEKLKGAINALTTELNAKIKEMQETFSKEKDELAAQGEKKKSENASAIIATEIAIVSAQYDEAINDLKKQIAKYEDKQ